MNVISRFSLALVLCATACIDDPDAELAEVEQEDGVYYPVYTPQHGDVLVLTMNGEADGVLRSLDAPWFGRAALAGDPVNQFKRHLGVNQRWQLISAGGYVTASGATVPTFQLRNQWSGLCMDFFQQTIRQQSCFDPNRFNSQRFHFQVIGSTTAQIKTATVQSYCIDVPYGAAQDGLAVQRYGCNAGWNQRWMIEKCLADGCSTAHSQGY